MGKKKSEDNIRHQYVFYESFHDAMRELPDEQYGRLMKAMNNYALYGDLPELTDVVEKMVWKLVMPILQKGRNKSHEGAGRPPSNRNQVEIKPKSNKNQTVSNPSLIVDMDNGEEKEKEDSSSGVSATDDNYEKFKNWYNSEIQNTQLSKISVMTQQRKDALDAAKAAVGGEKIAKALARAKESDYLMGWKEEGRKMSVEWFLNPNNICKILEGYYDN